eukprot:8122316-Lingulodinium_polyedra.AAC.1
MEYARRAICEPLRGRTVESIASFCTVFETVRNDAAESTVCRARLHGVRARAICEPLRRQT